MPRKKLPSEPFVTFIDRLLDNGRGLCEHQDRQLEVSESLAGETVRARYRFGRRFRGQAQLVEVLEFSADRVSPRCAHFGTCSACALQHMDLAAQRAFKQQGVLDRLHEIGKVTPAEVLPPLCGEAWHYRRKSRLSVRWVTARERILVGFREQDGRFVTDMRECHVLPVRLMPLLDGLRSLIGELDAARMIPQVEVSCGDDDTAIILRHLEPLTQPDRSRLAAFAEREGFALWLQPGGPDSVEFLAGAPRDLEYALPDFDVRFRFGPLDFVQVNGELNRRMVRAAVELLDPGPEDHVLDLFCGLGNFSLPLARRAAHVTGIEGAAALVRRAADNATRNGIDNVTFLEMDLYGDAALDLAGKRPVDRVLLDPPRSGAGPALASIAALGAPRILYVSCNPDTLARDAGVLVAEHGYRLAAAGVMDMFPHTAHVESMALFEKESAEMNLD